MNAGDLKRVVTPERILRHYGSEPDSNGTWRCLFRARHTNEDRHHSVTVKHERAYCWSQGCLGEKGADIFELIRLVEHLTEFKAQKARIAELFFLNGKARGKNIIATYNYTDEQGTLLFQTVRYDPKDFRQRRPQYTETLKGKAIIVIPDQDEPGRKHAEDIAEALKIIHALHVPEGLKDFSEWVAQGLTQTQFHEALTNTQPFLHPKETKAFQFQLTSMADLLAEPEEDTAWLVETLLPQGGLSVIGGKPKTGKSTSVRNLCLSVARGEPFLGFPTAQGSVIYCAFEEKRGEVKRHFQLLGFRPDDPVYSFIGRAPHDFIDKIQPIITDVKPTLIILDTLVKVTHVKDMNDYSQVMQGLDPFLHLARQSGAHLLLVHHAGKSDREGGDNLLGSTGIFASVDTCLIQKRSDKYRTLQSINRYGTDLEESVIEWDEDTKAISLGGSKKDSEVSRFCDEILTFLHTQGEPVSRELIEENVEGGTGVKRKALKKLVEMERVARTGKGSKGNPFQYSCLVVPLYSGEQENKNPKNGQISHEQRADSCSQASMDFDGEGNDREQEKLRTQEQETPGREEPVGPFEEVEW